MPAPTTNPAMLSPFHLAFPVHDITLARKFYGDLLGCRKAEARTTGSNSNF